MVFYSAWSGLWQAGAPNSAPATTFFPPASKYKPARDVPIQTGKVFIVTGGNSGIGYETTKQLLLKRARVYIAARDPTKANAAINALERETGKRALLLIVDLQDLDSVRACAEEFLSREDKLDVLYNNAGVLYVDPKLLTKQGYDLNFGASIMGHYLLSVLLLPALKRATQAGRGKARVLWTSSALHTMSPGDGLFFDTFKGGTKRDAVIEKWSKMARSENLYNLRVLAAVLIAGAFDRAHSQDLVSAIVHPGLLKTPMINDSTGAAARIVQKLAWPAEMGAYTMLFGGTSLDGDSFGGKYLIPWARIGVADKRATNVAQQDKLKRWLDQELAPWLQH